MKQNPPSPEEMEKYLSGELSNEDMYQIEQKLSDNDFFAEAMDGYEANPDALAGLNDVKDQFYQKLNQPAAKPFWTSSNMLITGLSVISIVAISLLLYNYSQDSTLEKKDSLVEVKNPKKEETPAVPVVVKENITDKEIEEESEVIDNAKLIPQNKQITSQKTVEDQQPMTDVTNLEVDPNLIEDPFDTTNLVVIENDDPRRQPEEVDPEPVKPKKIFKVNVATDYIEDLLVIDYKGIYKSDIKKTTIDVTESLHPSMEHHDDEPIEEMNDIVVVYTPYAEFLEGAMKKFKKNQFKTALKDFLVILKHYPEDVNAHFYGGLCYYNINKSKKAIRYFEHVIENQFNALDQEAEFYKALSLLQNRDTWEGEKLLKHIVNENGFYAERAQGILDEM